jgi:hypothetical protein
MIAVISVLVIQGEPNRGDFNRVLQLAHRSSKRNAELIGMVGHKGTPGASVVTELWRIDDAIWRKATKDGEIKTLAVGEWADIKGVWLRRTAEALGVDSDEQP